MTAIDVEAGTLQPDAARSTVDPEGSSGETELRSACEPVGVQEVAVYLQVAPGTVMQWLNRPWVNIPPPDWTVNGQEAWNLTTIKAWAIAAGKLEPADIDRYDAEWEQAKAAGRLLTRRQQGELARRQAAANGSKPVKKASKAKKAPAKKRAQG